MEAGSWKQFSPFILVDEKKKKIDLSLIMLINISVGFALSDNAQAVCNLSAGKNIGSTVLKTRWKVGGRGKYSNFIAFSILPTMLLVDRR